MADDTHVLVVEDEPLLRQQLVESLRSLWPELTDIAEAGSGGEAILRINERRPHFAFLDINLPDFSGLELARLLKGHSTVVFVTAYDEYAVAAFEQEAVDYVLKPATRQRLAETVNRLRGISAARRAPDLERLLARLAGQAVAPTAYLRWLQTSVGNALQLIPVDDVLYFQADEKYTQIVTRDGGGLVRKPIRELCQELDPEKFWQIHRSAIVRLDAISRVIRSDAGQMTVHLRDSETVLPVSRSFASRFKQM